MIKLLVLPLFLGSLALAQVQYGNFVHTAGADRPEAQVAKSPATGSTKTYEVTGDGVTDNSEAMQRVVNNCPAAATCTYYLSNTVIQHTVVIDLIGHPAEYRFLSRGGATVCSAAPACFERRGGDAKTPLPHRWSFTGITFVRHGSGPVIWDNLIFASGGNQGLTLDDDTFYLRGPGTIGWEGTGSDFNIFNNDIWDLCSDCIALKPVGRKESYGPQTTEVTNNNFRGGIAVAPSIDDCGYGWQGWTFTANQFFASRVTAACGNTITFIGNQFVSAHFKADSLFGGYIIGNYFDGPGGTDKNPATLLGVTNSYHDMAGLMIEGNYFQLGSEKNLSGISLYNGTAPKNSFETTNITITGNAYTGGSESSANPVFGVVFDDRRTLHVYLGQDNYRQLYSALDFRAPIGESTIDQFEARDVIYYARGIANYIQPPGGGGSNITDHLYKVVKDVHVAGYLGSTVASATAIASAPVYWDTMFNLPAVTVTVSGSDPCTPNWGVSAARVPGLNSTSLVLVARPGAAVGPGSCGADVVIDGTRNTRR